MQYLAYWILKACMCIAGFASRRPIYAKPKGERTKITVSLATTVISYLALCNA